MTRYTYMFAPNMVSKSADQDSILFDSGHTIRRVNAYRLNKLDSSSRWETCESGSKE